MNNHAFPFENETAACKGMTDRDYVATQILQGMAANPNLVDVTNINRAAHDADSGVQADETELQGRMVAFARMLADRMIAELNTVPTGI